MTGQKLCGRKQKGFIRRSHRFYKIIWTSRKPADAATPKRTHSPPICHWEVTWSGHKCLKTSMFWTCTRKVTFF
jgi:hypothetical protein